MYHHQLTFGDWGIILFELIAGKIPFNPREGKTIVDCILNDPVRIPNFFSHAAEDLTRQLLTRDPQNRLRDFKELKKHEFFDNFDWYTASLGNMPPPFAPSTLLEDGTPPDEFFRASEDSPSLSVNFSSNEPSFSQ